MVEDLARTETGHRLPSCLQGQNVLLVTMNANETMCREMEPEIAFCDD